MVRRRTDMGMLRPEELVRQIQECPIVYVPSGIYEWHDEQNPLGTDTLKVVEMCRRAATRTGGLVHMPSYIGVGAFFNSMSGMKNGGLNFSEKLVRSYLTELMEQLEKMGFELIVLLYGHTNTENINAHQQASDDFMRRQDTHAKVLCVNDAEPVVRHRYKVADHAAKWETSFMMATHPDCVGMESIPADHGVWHGLDPRVHASATEGDRMYELIATAVSDLVHAALVSSREQLLEGSFTQSRECWKTCQNVRDLQEDYWRGDEKWEDPSCYFCIWRSPGLITALAGLKGADWTNRRIVHWDSCCKCFTGRIGRAWEEIKKEAASLAEPHLARDG